MAMELFLSVNDRTGKEDELKYSKEKFNQMIKNLSGEIVISSGEM